MKRLFRCVPWVLVVYLMAEEYGGVPGRLLIFSFFIILARLLSVLLRAPILASFLAVFPLCLIHFVSRTKYRLLGSPLYFWDLKYLAGKDQLDVLQHYLSVQGVGLLLVILAASIGIIVSICKRERIQFQSRYKQKATHRFLKEVGVFSLYFFLLSGAVRALNAEAKSWGYFDRMGKRHPISLFLWSAQSSTVTLYPKAKSLPGDRQLTSAWTHSSSHPNGRRLPHLVMILQESLADPRILSQQWTRETHWDPLLRPSRKNGSLEVSVFGGGTWCSEFTSLVGVPTSAFGVMGNYATYIFQEKVKFSLVSHLRTLGYRTVAIYPGPGDFVNGERFHRSLGFDQFLDAKDQIALHGSYWGLPDVNVYQTALKILQEHEQKEPDRPLFLWLKTIHNHGPHDRWPKQGCHQLGASSVANMLLKGGYDPLRECALVDYLERVEESKKAYIQLKDRFNRPGDFTRPISVVQFGDHQPTFFEGLTRPGLGSIGKNEKHLTFYSFELLRSLTPAQESPPPQLMNLAYLGAYWLDWSGLPLSPFHENQVQVSQVCDGYYPVDMSSPGGTPPCLDAISALHADWVKDRVLDL